MSKTDTKIAKKSKVTKVASTKVGIVYRVGDDGDTYADFGKIQGDNLAGLVKRTLANAMGAQQVSRMQQVYSLRIISTYLDQIKSQFDDYCVEYNDSSSDGAMLVEKATEYHKAAKEQITAKIASGLVEFEDIPFLFEEGHEVATNHGGEFVSGIVETVELKSSFFSTYYQIGLKVISNVSGEVQDLTYKTAIMAFRGQKSLSRLPVHHINEAEKALLSERGETFRKYATGIHYVHYKGQLTQSSYWSERNFRADGRVVIDIGSFQQIENDQLEQEKSQSGIETADRYDRANSVPTSIELHDEDLWRTYPYLYGFSFKAKQWGRMAVKGLSEIAWREDAWDKLVLPAEEKELIKAIVEFQGDTFSDIVDEKGGGSIFLLHGPPGQGKTLSAETIAEILKRPLYAVSVGELGVSPEDLEERLRTILDLATVWNAVLLLDEADIFLEARTDQDVVRNALVGVFLRLTEYFQGVLFLTTNRVKNIDAAFYSRISIALSYPSADIEKRRQIWVNLLGSAGLDDKWSDRLAHFEINGRQVKNVIRAGQSLALAKGEEITIDHLIKVIDLTTHFEKQMVS